MSDLWKVLCRAAGAAALPLVLLAVAGVASAAPDAPDPEERERLEQGRILVAAKGSAPETGFAVHASALVDAPPAQVWPVVRDCELFDRFMPRTRHSALLEQGEDTTVCSVTVDLPFPFGELFSVVRSRLTRLPEGGFERRWSLLRGDFEHSEGSWRVAPWNDAGTRTLLVYQQAAKPKTELPESLLRLAQRRSLPRIIEAIRRRVQELETEVASTP